MNDTWKNGNRNETHNYYYFFYFRYFFGSNVSQFWLDYFISVQFLFCSFHFCHVNAGNKFQLHYPEYYAAYKHGHDGLRQPAPTETVTFEVTILRATNTYSQLQITFHTYLAKCVYALWFSPVVTKPLYCYTGLPCLQWCRCLPALALVTVFPYNNYYSHVINKFYISSHIFQAFYRIYNYHQRFGSHY